MFPRIIGIAAASVFVAGLALQPSGALAKSRSHAVYCNDAGKCFTLKGQCESAAHDRAPVWRPLFFRWWGGSGAGDDGCKVSYSASGHSGGTPDTPTPPTPPSEASLGNPGNNKSVGHAGETPGPGNWGNGQRGKSQ